MDVESVVTRLKGVKPIIREILDVSGTVGFSYGVIHYGQVVHKEGFGCRDVNQKLPVDTRTMFSICSMTKGLVSAALGILVQQGKLQWNSLISDILPDWAPQSPQLRS